MMNKIKVAIALIVFVPLFSYAQGHKFQIQLKLQQKRKVVLK